MDVERSRCKAQVRGAIASRELGALDEAMAVHTVLYKSTFADETIFDQGTSVPILMHEFRALAQEAVSLRDIEKLRAAIDGVVRVRGELRSAARPPSATVFEEDGVGGIKMAAKPDRPTLSDHPEHAEARRRNDGDRERTGAHCKPAAASTVDWYKYCVVRPDGPETPLRLELQNGLSSVEGAKSATIPPSAQDDLIRQAIAHRLEAAVAAARYGRGRLLSDHGRCGMTPTARIMAGRSTIGQLSSGYSLASMTARLLASRRRRSPMQGSAFSSTPRAALPECALMS
jgi:hypothetical protein